MKKIALLFAALILWACGPSSQDVVLTFNVNGAASGQVVVVCGGSINSASLDSLGVAELVVGGVDAAYAIEEGKITKRIKGVTLIGNGKDILNQVEMVADDLELGDGYCGSKSGMVPVTCGQPSIKISKILVGGKE